MRSYLYAFTLRNICKIALPFISLCTVALTSCNGDTDTNVEKTPEKQGVIIYNVDYPEVDKENIMYAMLPKKVALTYRGNTYKTVVGVKAVGFNTTIISDTDDRNLTAVFELGGKKLFSEMSADEVDVFLNEFPEVDYSDSSTVSSSLNLQCIHTSAILGDLTRKTEIVHSTEIPIENPNWCNPYKQIDGTLLKYEIQYYGVLMSFEAVSVVQDTILPKDEFEIPKNFQHVSYEKIKEELTKLFTMINGDA